VSDPRSTDCVTAIVAATARKTISHGCSSEVSPAATTPTTAAHASRARNPATRVARFKRAAAVVAIPRTLHELRLAALPLVRDIAPSADGTS
jgi:hypothetical protein